MTHRVISNSELKQILGAHTEWLVDNMKGQRANLSSADLSSADLSSADLRSANLRSANLLIFQYQRQVAYFTLDGTMRIGCVVMPITEWAEGYKQIGKANNYTEVEIEAYGGFIKLCLKLFKRKNT